MRMSNGQQKQAGDGVATHGQSCVQWGVLGVRRSPLASGQCRTLPARSVLIRLYFGRGLCALRVCGKKSCFSTQAKQAEVGKLVLQRLALQESDNCSPSSLYPQTPNYQLVTHLHPLPHPHPPQNLQHSFAIFSSLFPPPLATLICTAKRLLFYTKFSSLSPLPGKRFQKAHHGHEQLG